MALGIILISFHLWRFLHGSQQKHQHKFKEPHCKHLKTSIFLSFYWPGCRLKTLIICRCCRINVLLVIMQVCLGGMVTALAVYMETLTPSLRMRECPYWAGLPVSRRHSSFWKSSTINSLCILEPTGARCRLRPLVSSLASFLFQEKTFCCVHMCVCVCGALFGGWKQRCLLGWSFVENGQGQCTCMAAFPDERGKFVGSDSRPQAPHRLLRNHIWGEHLTQVGHTISGVRYMCRSSFESGAPIDAVVLGKELFCNEDFHYL